MTSSTPAISRLALASAIAGAILTAPLGARAADLVVWWEKGFYAQEDEAVREIIATFEQDTGRQVELVLPPQEELLSMAEAALQAGEPPDFLWGTTSERWLPRWADEGRLVDLEPTLEPVLDLFDADATAAGMLPNGKTGKRGLYGMPMARSSNHVHMWNSLLERAGFRRDDIPTEWEAFWSFWCDQVQPAVRAALGRDDVWGVGLPMSVSIDTSDEFAQFTFAYDASWLDPEGYLRIDDPAVQAGLTRALEAYTAIWRKGCTPPDAVDWTNYDNNKAFLEQRVVMTINPTLSIPGALKTDRPADYYENAASIPWPNAVSGEPLVLLGSISRAVVFKQGAHPATAAEFVRFLAEEGWLAHWLSFAGDRWLPPMRKLVEQPFWLDTSDPHRLRAAVQTLTQQHRNTYTVRDHELQSAALSRENVWGHAIHQVAADGVAPEQAARDAIARIKEILGK